MENQIFNFFDIFSLANYSSVSASNSVYIQLLELIVIITISGVTAVLLTKKGNGENLYNNLYQLLRIALRYKLSAALFTYAFIKIFPLQMPFPSLSDLNTEYGDFLPWKVYFLTIGLAKANYETIIGLAELSAAVLLLCRRTATTGAIVALGLFLNIIPSNFAYQIGGVGYSIYLFVIALFLVSYDVPRIYNLLLEKPALANRTKISFNGKWQRNTRIALKSAFILLMIIYSLGAYNNYVNNPYLLPQNPGLEEAAGLYNVQEFRINDELIPYSKNDTNRWQNVVFEEWGTLSIHTARSIPLDNTRPGVENLKDLDRVYESAGNIGRHFYTYTIDSNQQTLHLQNKNIHQRNETLELHYTRPDSSTIILSGVNQARDSIYTVLTKVDKKYLLFEGRRKPVRL